MLTVKDVNARLAFIETERDRQLAAVNEKAKTDKAAIRKKFRKAEVEYRRVLRVLEADPMVPAEPEQEQDEAPGGD
jgi:hypothetical protein